jgi:nucleotide-binding universal stress UspA family protein
MTRGRHDLRWTVVAGYEGSASSEDALALARSVLGVAGDRLVVGCVYQYQPLRGRFASGELATAVARRGCGAVRSSRAEPMAVPAVSPAEGLCSLAAATHADLVVVGSARRALRGRLLRGSTADGMLCCGVCSVAIAPSGYGSHQHRFRTVGVIFDRTLPSRAAVRTAAAIALAEDGVVRVYATAGALPGNVQGVLAPLLGGAPLQAVGPVRAVTADSEKILDLVVTSSHRRFRLPGSGRRQGGRWIRACRCPVLVLPESQTAAGGSAPAADREEATW